MEVNDVKSGICDHCSMFSSVLFLVSVDGKEMNVCCSCIRESLRGKFKYVGGTKRQQLNYIKKKLRNPSVFKMFVEKGNSIVGSIDTSGNVRASILPHGKIPRGKYNKQWRWSFFHGLHVYNGDFMDGDRERVIAYLEKVYKISTSNITEGFTDIERIKQKVINGIKPTCIKSPKEVVR